MTKRYTPELTKTGEGFVVDTENEQGALFGDGFISLRMATDIADWLNDGHAANGNAFTRDRLYWWPKEVLDQLRDGTLKSSGDIDSRAVSVPTFVGDADA